jgi:hypothetical protein
VRGESAGAPRGAAGVAVLAVLLAGCTVEAEHPALKDAKLPPLIQAHQLAYRGNLGGRLPALARWTPARWFGPSFGRSMLHVRNNETGAVRKYRVGGTFNGRRTGGGCSSSPTGRAPRTSTST